MFPEYHDLITKLSASDDHFGRLVEKHTLLDQKIKDMVRHTQLATQEEIETLKKEKLLVKDQVFAILTKAAPVHRVS
jgi:uncharacterized protein YdcH (DUF465 family)